MREIVFTLKDPLGIHARPAGMLVKEASKFKSSIKINSNDKTADAKRIFSVMGLGAKCGDRLNIIIEGDDEIPAENEIRNFLEKNL